MKHFQELPENVQNSIIELVLLDERHPPSNVEEASINRSQVGGWY